MKKPTIYRLTLTQKLDGSKAQLKEDSFEAELREDGKCWFKTDKEEAVLSPENFDAPVSISQGPAIWEGICWCHEGNRFNRELTLRNEMWIHLKEVQKRFASMVDSIDVSIAILEKNMVKHDLN